MNRLTPTRPGETELERDTYEMEALCRLIRSEPTRDMAERRDMLGQLGLRLFRWLDQTAEPAYNLPPVEPVSAGTR